MDSHSIVEDTFWQSADSMLFESAVATVMPGLPCPSVVFSTSGSTGLPRRIAISKQSLLVSAAAVNEHLDVSTASVWGLCLPWWHVGGFGVIARAYQAGAKLAVSPARWDAEICHEWLCVEKVTHLSLVPTQVHDLILLGKQAPSSLRAIVVGGGRLEQRLGQRARDLGWPVLASYGMTEAGSQIATQSMESLGQAYASEPLPILSCWQVRGGEDGRLEISGDALFHGEMIGRADELRYQARFGDWYITQDCGIIDANGLRLTHRHDSLIKVLGELVNPESIESALQDAELPAGKFVVLAIADARKEHRLVLVHEHLDRAAIASALAAYHSRCAGYARIDECREIAAFPRSALGKILRRELLVLLA